MDLERTEDPLIGPLQIDQEWTADVEWLVVNMERMAEGGCQPDDVLGSSRSKPDLNVLRSARLRPMPSQESIARSREGRIPRLPSTWSGEVPLTRLISTPLQVPFALGQFFDKTLDPESATRAIQNALRDREERFLHLVRSQVFERRESPYLELFRSADCEMEDVKELVCTDGLEAALGRLAAEGVYLSTEEFKGRRPVVRGSSTFEVRQKDLQPGHRAWGLQTESSGSSNRPSRSLSSLGWLGRESATTCLFLAAHGLENHAHAAVDVIAPGAAGVLFLLMVAKAGIRPERWFCRRPHHGWLERRYQVMVARQIVRGARRYGPGFPAPEFVDFQDLNPIVDWIRCEERRGREICIRCVASIAVTIAKTALVADLPLTSVTFIVTGEPFTESKREIVEQSGARFTVQYGYTPGAVHVGRGCARRRSTDEMHVDLSTLAVIEHSRQVADSASTLKPLLCTTLYPEASVFQLNVENGDTAVMERRDCGCLLGEAGFDLLIRRVRSFEKFTCRGMNYAFTDLYGLIEERLPTMFGGGPGDYQLVEEGQSGGEVSLTLRIDPEVGPVDETKVLRALGEGLSETSRSQRFMARIWQESEVLRVRREPPQVSTRGKISPLVLNQDSE